jgi:hypothetical protein
MSGLKTKTTPNAGRGSKMTSKRGSPGDACFNEHETDEPCGNHRKESQPMLTKKRQEWRLQLQLQTNWHPEIQASHVCVSTFSAACA